MGAFETTPTRVHLSRESGALGRRTQQIVTAMGEAIVSGHYPSDVILPVEAVLADQFGASRPILREAVKVLSAKGLVTSRPRRGTSVTPPSQWNLFDPDVLEWILNGAFSLPLLVEFTHVRLGLEPEAARLAATRGDGPDIAAIERGYARMEAARDGADDALEADIAFHLAILDASGNRFLARLKPFVAAALHFSIRYTDNIARDEDAKLVIHRNVYEAIARGDPVAAAGAARTLLEDARALMDAGHPIPAAD
ncbi:MAG: FadR/GntR family transcriptional regulator [Sphingomonas sp.]